MNREIGWFFAFLMWQMTLLATCHMNDGWQRVEERKVDAMERCK